ncbi:MAG TPA: hypothetical protein VN780_02515 [Candidatus Eisenbacteria bacterium]|nr:hypothetical protein [Candidatus Eisenbacteria bacterium]
MEDSGTGGIVGGAMSIGFPSVSNKVTDFGGPKVGGAVASEFATIVALSGRSS